jgi:outer membrane receptor protein involved in Fe transport
VAPLLALLLGAAPRIAAQSTGATITGMVLDAETRAPVPLARVGVEGTPLLALTDSAGRYRLTSVPAGPRIVTARRIGFAETRVQVVAPPRGNLTLDLALARSSLLLEDVRVTADAAGTARGELGTATVIGRDAIANQTAASLLGVLELVPGTPLAPPGLDGPQQIALRTVPTSGSGPPTPGVASASSASELAAFGTLIVLDGIPLSNNANLQTPGPRAELRPPGVSRGGVDLRRIPATTLERVEVIRGIPSARYGDLTQGAIIVDTRAGEVRPDALVRYDPYSIEGSLVGGRTLGDRHAVTATGDVTRTRISPGLSDAAAYRVAVQLAHQYGRPATQAFGMDPRFSLDTRLDLWQLRFDRPEQPGLLPGSASSQRDRGLRLSQRMRLRGGETRALEFSVAIDHARQHAFTQGLRLRPALPFTDRLTEGRSTGFFVGGSYLSQLTVDGSPWMLYGRLEGQGAPAWLGVMHELRGGVETRREWNDGAGVQFDIATPPQVSFNGVNGFDRPRPYDDVPDVGTTAFYADDRLTIPFAGTGTFEMQAGVRLDLLHVDGWPATVRDVALQPRLTAQLSPRPWIRLRASAGEVAKTPPLASLSPAPQYYDVVNVNWFTNDPAERLAVVTTFIRDPTNPDLGFSIARKAEVGLEVTRGEAALSFVRFSDRIRDAVGFRSVPTSIGRDRYSLTDSTTGTGQPPGIIEPPYATDVIPVLIDRPENNLTVRNSGWELTAAFPEIVPLRTRIEVQGAWIETRLDNADVDFGSRSRFSDFQLMQSQSRAPFWEGATRFGERALLTTRLVHHRADLGLVITGTVQHTLEDATRDIAGVDTLAFAGYLTRDGTLVHVAPDERADPQYADLRQPRAGVLGTLASAPSDWLMSLQVAKSLPFGGRLSFYAFNALDRRGRFAASGSAARVYPQVRYGAEITLPLTGWR